MIITEQQALVLFDIGKEAMKQKGGFAGYSNAEIMRLLNDIISQQDNIKNIVINEFVNDAGYEKTQIYSNSVSDVLENNIENNTKNDDFSDSATDALENNTESDNFWDY